MNTQTTCCHVSKLLTGNHDIFNNSLIKIPRILFLCKKRREVELLAGWSDIALFATFENGHYAADQI